jgi:hypothetical protein
MKDKIKMDQKSDQLNTLNVIKKFECNINKYAFEWDFIPSVRIWSKIVSIRTQNLVFHLFSERWLFFEFVFLNIKAYFGISLYRIKRKAIKEEFVKYIFD